MKLQKINKMYKKGQFESILLAVITIFIIGIILFFFNHVNEQVYGALEDHFETDDNLNGTQADIALEKLHDIEQTNIWDYVFLAIFVGFIIQQLIFAFATRINIAFFWLFILIGIIILIVGTVLSNIWQDTASNPEFSSTIDRFPITNTLLGTYYPVTITAIIFIVMLVLFGKPPD